MINRPSILALFLVAFALAASGPAARADYQLQRKSQFQQKLVLRNVFWPIGYVHVDESAARQQVALKPTAPKLGADQFVVSSILIGGGLPLAVINGQDRGIGEMLLVQGVNVQVASIRDGSVVLRYEGSDINVPLKQ